MNENRVFSMAQNLGHIPIHKLALRLSQGLNRMEKLEEVSAPESILETEREFVRAGEIAARRRVREMAAAFSSLVSILQDRGEANDEAAVLETVLLRPREVDALLRYSSGRTRRLALKGLIAHIILPDGEMRIRKDTVDAILNPSVAPAERSE